MQCEGLGHAGAVLLPTLVAAVATLNTTVDWFINAVVTCSVGTFTAQQGVIEVC